MSVLSPLWRSLSNEITHSCTGSPRKGRYSQIGGRNGGARPGGGGDGGERAVSVGRRVWREMREPAITARIAEPAAAAAAAVAVEPALR